MKSAAIFIVLLTLTAPLRALTLDFFEVDSEYLWPIYANRQIQTFSLDGWVGKHLAEGHVDVGVGATLTHPWGQITQLLGDYSLGTLHSVQYGTSALGAGPALLLRLNAFPEQPLSVFFDASGGFLLYDQHFPPGGDIYNFMFRLGPGLLFKCNSHFSLVLRGEWMHVSNGQGLGSFNPSYEANGLNLGLQFPL